MELAPVIHSPICEQAAHIGRISDFGKLQAASWWDLLVIKVVTAVPLNRFSLPPLVSFLEWDPAFE